MEFKIPEHLQYSIISISLEGNNKLIMIKFGIPYDNKEIISPFDIKDISNSMEKLEHKIKKTIGISKEDYNEIESIILAGFSNYTGFHLHQLTDKKLDKKQIAVYKYSKNRKSNLYESILLDGEPTFLLIDSENGLAFQSFIEEKTRILKPPENEEYLHEPFSFESKEEIEKLYNKVKNLNIFSLYEIGKSIVSKYIDQDPHLKQILTIDIIFSFLQDRYPTVHYLGIFGDNNSGKSSIGDIFEALAYRAVNTTDPSPANIFRSLGSVEPGQITLVLDEAEKIDQSHDMMTILKTGYDYRKTVSKVNDFSRKPEKFFTYCQKLIIGERAPSPNLAKGLNDRIFSDIVYYGTPRYDIKEILNTTDASDQEYQILFEEIREFRKILFLYRLIHFKDRIKNIDIGITARKKELVKPYLQLFSDTSSDKDKRVFQEIQSTFEKFLRIKNDKKDFTIEAALVPIIIELMEKSKCNKIKFSDFWDKVRYVIPGHFDEKKPNEYHTADFGILYRNSITHTLQKLGVETKRHNSFVELIFSFNKIGKIASQYNVKVQTSLIDGQGERSERSIDPLVQKIPREGDKQLDNSVKIVLESNENGLNTDESELKDTFVKSLEDINNDYPHPGSSPHTQHSPKENTEETRSSSIYRIGKTDTWACEKCNVRDDIWFMQQHPCRGT